MTQTGLQKGFAPIRRYFPNWIANPVRRFGTAFLMPVLFSYRTGHFLSSLKAKAVQKNSEPLPWYTYSSIDFLRFRSYTEKYVLEFGGGQSTLWWAKRAKHVVSLEGSKDWYEKIKSGMPPNVDLYLVSMESSEACISDVTRILGSKSRRFDVIVVDGLYRREMAEIAKTLGAEDGVIICDNAEGYGFYEAFKNSGLNRVDFFGNAPGVVMPHATSIFFKSASFPFSAEYPIPVIAKEN
jgi:hypothetical protein